MDWTPLLLSFRVATLGCVLAALLGVALAALLSWRPFWGRDLLDVAVTAPMVFPPTVLGYYVLVALGRTSFVGRSYEALTGSSIVFSEAGAVVAALLGALPMVVMSARAALENVDPLLLQAARTLGAGAFRTFFTVRLPLATSGIAAGIMLGYARALGDFGVTLMVAGNIPGETQTASLAIYDAIQANREESASGMIVMLSAVAVALLYGTQKLARSHRVR